MERIIIKIQSVSDVITNSSTEIYTVCTEYTLDRLKDIVNSILEISGSSLKAAKYLSDIMDIFEQDVCYNS